MSLPNSHLSETVPVLIDNLHEALRIHFAESLAWEGKWAEIRCYTSLTI